MLRFFFRKLRNYPFSLGCALVIWVGCLMPLPKHTLPEFRWSDKAVHALLYLVLCGCIWVENAWAHRHTKMRTSTGRMWAGAVALPAVMSGMIELAQEYFTMNRSGEWADWTANTAGCLLAAAAGFWSRKYY